jgi:hypothetical protein
MIPRNPDPRRTPDPIIISTAAAVRRDAERSMNAILNSQLWGDWTKADDAGLNISRAADPIDPETFARKVREACEELRGAVRDPHEGIIDIPRRHYQTVRGLWMGTLKQLATHDAPEYPPHAALLYGVPFHASEVVEPGCTVLVFRNERVIEAYVSPHPPGWIPPIKPRLLRNIKRDTRGPGHPRRSKKRRK